jgi:cytochrome c-type biogenesis protein CcmE
MFFKNKFIKQRFTVISIATTLIAIGVALLLYVFSNNIVLYSTPSTISNATKSNVAIRLGGKVKSGSVKRSDNGTLEFVVHEGQTEIKVVYAGIIPSLFKEEQEVIVRGKMNKHSVFEAKELLAKHDENYKPKHTQHQKIEETK